MALHVKRKLVSSSIDNFKINGKESIRALINRINLPEVLEDYLRVSIDGVVITKEEWERTHAYNNNIVFVGVVPQGGDSGKNPLAMIAMIALTVFTAGVMTPWAAGIWGATAGAAVGAATMFVGSLLINALFPPPEPKAIAGDDSTGFLSFEGQKNALRAGAGVRNIYGTFKVAPDLAAEVYVVTDGLVQTLYALYDFGYGDVNVSQVLIGNTSIDSYKDAYYKVHQNYTNGTLSYYENDNITESFSVELREVDYVVRTTATAEADAVMVDINFPIGLAFYKDSEIRQYSAGISLTIAPVGTDPINGTWVNISGFDDIYESGAIRWGNADTPVSTDKVYFLDLYDVVNDGTSLGYSYVRSSTTFQVEVVGIPYSVVEFSDDQRSARVETILPPVIAGQTLTIDGIIYTVESATAVGGIETVCKLISSSRNGSEESCYKRQVWDIELNKATPEGERIPNEYTYVEIEFDVERAYGDILYGGEAGWHPPSWIYGSIRTSVEETTSSYFTVHRTTGKPFTLSIGFPLPSQGEWDIRLKRTYYPRYDELDLGRYSFLDKTILSKIQTITKRQPLDFKTPHTILELKIHATDQLNGSVDTLSAMCSRVLKTWDAGIFEEKVTTNPAWVALDILQGPANPDPIPDDRVDLDAYIDWAGFCSTKMPAPNDDKDCYEVNTTWDAMSTVFERLKEVWSSGRATYASVENKHSVIWEQFPVVPTQLFTPKNSWGFKGTRTFTKQPHGLNVSFIDPASQWQQVEKTVYNDGYAEVDGVDVVAATYFENLNLPLCTRWEQAYRDGRYFLAEGTLRPESFSINVDIENLVCQRGDLVELQQDVAFIGGVSTRVTKIVDSGTAMEISFREPYYCTGDDCQIRFRFNDNSQEQIAIAVQYNPALDEYTIEMSYGTYPSKLNVGDLVVYGEQNSEENKEVTDQFLVKSITPAKDLTATIMLVPIAYEIQNSDTETIPDYEPSITDIAMPTPICVFGVMVDKEIVYRARYPYLNVKVSWIGLGSNVKYEIWWSQDDSGSYELVDIVKDIDEYTLVNLKSTLDRDFNTDTDQFVKVIPVNAFGNKPAFDNCQGTAFRFIRDTTVPGKPLFMSGNINADTMNLNWSQPDDEDIAGYKLKFTNELDNPRWDEASVHGNFIPYNITTESINARIGTYMIKTVDTSGHDSVDFALVRTTVPSLRGFELFQAFGEQDSGFIGDTESTEKVTESIDVDEVPTDFTGIALTKPDGGEGFGEYGVYNYNTIVDLGDIYNCYISNDIKRKLLMIDPLLETPEKFQDVIVELRMSSHNPSMSEWDFDQFPVLYPNNLASVDELSTANDGTWSGWNRLYAGYYTGRYFEFRVVLVSIDPNISPLVYEMNIQFDTVLRTESQEDIQVTDTVNPTHIAFLQEFIRVPTIIINEDNATLGGRFAITNKSAAGFDIAFYDSGDTQTTGQFDYIAQGSGTLYTEFNKPNEPYENDDLSLLANALTTEAGKDILT